MVKKIPAVAKKQFKIYQSGVFGIGWVSIIYAF